MVMQRVGTRKKVVLMSNEQEKRDNENYAKNFTRVCKIILDSYKHLTYEEKFLYIKMREVYWDAKPRFATLREISHLTGYAISALSRILPRLHKCALIHAEIKQEYNPDGTKKGKPKYYISIPDIWELNRKYYECSPQERFDPSVVLLENKNVLHKNENVLLENKNVLHKNENVLLENDVVPPREHFCPTPKPSQARPQLSKDKKDIYKIESKNEGALVSENQQDALTHSSTPSLSSEVVPNVEKLSTQAPSELTPEEERIQGYWQALGFVVSSQTHWGTLSKHIHSLEEMESLFKYTRASINENAGIKDKQVHPGNLVKCLNGWKQAQMAPAPQLQESKPKKVKITREYLDAVGY
jgi:hypothetical protein